MSWGMEEYSCRLHSVQNQRGTYELVGPVLVNVFYCVLPEGFVNCLILKLYNCTPNVKCHLPKNPCSMEESQGLFCRTIIIIQQDHLLLWSL
jgi:hypothetical protein